MLKSAFKCVIVGQRYVCVKMRDGGATVYAFKCVIEGKGVKDLLKNCFSPCVCKTLVR